MCFTSRKQSRYTCTKRIGKCAEIAACQPFNLVFGHTCKVVRSAADIMLLVCVSWFCDGPKPVIQAPPKGGSVETGAGNVCWQQDETHLRQCVVNGGVEEIIVSRIPN